MIAAVYVVILALLLTACSYAIPVSKPGSTETDWRRDLTTKLLAAENRPRNAEEG